MSTFIKAGITTLILFLLGSLILVSNALIDSKATERGLLKDLEAITLDFSNYRTYAKEQIEDLNTLYSSREDTKDYFTDQVLKYKKDSNRGNIILKKPGLITIKINKSFNEFMETIYEETK